MATEPHPFVPQGRNHAFVALCPRSQQPLSPGSGEEKGRRGAGKEGRRRGGEEGRSKNRERENRGSKFSSV